MENGTQFFNDQQDIYQIYLRKTDQKLKTATAISEAVRNLFDPLKPLRMVCIGGGTGDVDLGVASLLPKYSFEAENVDPSMVMLEKFAKTASSLKNVRLANNQCLRFEDSKTKVLMADIVLCINSIYFLRGWSKCDRNNPILKQSKKYIPMMTPDRKVQDILTSIAEYVVSRQN